ncbi:MAG: Adenine-specific DNA methylase containing a Zn-ribbon [Phormidesmis priestleyi Ana]|uniref:Adenine-specific DNA methylase containing a Zn-ribbon n=1 Tax=Phormidesmis priestleyi Ana TaxID=1666911 RepID=A0A0P7ZJV5_9CYAN|nr:MAG: Adenine-specific DNA methylase containing a Zn-ribbon [Phormidesmis priestleyi Ana]
MPINPLTPLALQDAPSLIERVFPAQKVSAEAQKERKAGAGQTLTALGSYWKGRKPLIMVRAIVLGCLLPVTDDLEADLHIFEKLMAMDDAAFGRREPKLKVAEIAQRITLANPWDFFEYSNQFYDQSEIEALQFPLDAGQYPKLKLRWQRGLPDEKKHLLLAQALVGLPYEEKVRLCRRPEELDPEMLYGSIWEDVNAHLGEFGVEAYSHEALVEQLGMLRYGHRPRVGDTFCGGGSIPFEAARLGCDVYASDLNPVACMLTWGALNIIGASAEKRKEIEKAQREVAEAVDREITELGIEHNERGDRAKAFLYCLETRCPETGWMVPMAPSWVISKSRQVCARLTPNFENKRFDINVLSNASDLEMKAAAQGTVQDGSLVYELKGELYRHSIKTIRGDYRTESSENRNRLRQWELHDFKSLPNDIFQERLYCIQWITQETLGQSRQETYFSSVSDTDIDRERQIEHIVEKNIETWQKIGLVPDMVIEPGYNTDQPIRERGWRYWHHLFNPRQMSLFQMYFRNITQSGFAEYLSVILAKSLDWSNRLTKWDSSLGSDKVTNLFFNQALNTNYNYGCRGTKYLENHTLGSFNKTAIGDTVNVNSLINACNASDLSLNTPLNIWITDPPYADAVNYEEITEFFIAWLRKNPPAPFDQWTWDSRRALAIKGDGEDFRRGMVEAYRAMTTHMPDNGLQCVMFTHQDTSVWADMVSIFWAAGLQVVSAWYIATETTSELKQGGYVQGTVTLLLRKRLATASTFKQRLLPKIRKEVTAQIEDMLNLNDKSQQHGETVFNDSDLQMAGYAAALKVLTEYTEVDGRDMTTLALQPRQKGETTVVDDIVKYASEVANNLLIPDQLRALNPDTWSEITGVERFYLRMVAIEQTGAAKLDNYQNFSKAFNVAYQPLMASLEANKARLKGAKEFKPRELTGGDLSGTLLSELLIAIQELLNDKDPKVVLGQIRSSLDASYFQKRPHLMAMAHYLANMWRDRRPEEAQKAEIIGDRIRNEGI